MASFETIPKQWGNSLGLTIPKEIVESEHINNKSKVTVFVVSEFHKKRLKEAFGTLKCSTPTQKIMEEIDEGYDEH
ncbi:MAG: AbrB/MazE/SpoVT family DNA-binding domain-containing protein [Candidatus Woesearchaeota archaeon]